MSFRARWLWCVFSCVVACGSSNSNPGSKTGNGGTSGEDASTDADADAGADADAEDAGGAAGEAAVDAGSDVTVCETESDPENCGACGHSCLGGNCQDGKCKPLTLAVLDSEEPSYISVDSTSVYFVTSSDVRAVPKDASAPPVTLTSVSGAALRGIDRSGTSLYVADSNGSVQRTPIAGGPALPLWSGTGAPETLVAISPYVYWADPDANAILRVSQSGGAEQIVSSAVTQGVYALTREANVLYWVRRHGVVARLDLATTTPAVKIGDAGASSASPHVAIAVKSDRVWFSYGGSSGTPAIGLTVAASGGVQTTFTNDVVWGIATDNSDVYWSRVGLTGSIKRRPKPAGDPEEELVSGLTEVRSIALDGDAIYFSEYDASSNKGWIKKLAK